MHRTYKFHIFLNLFHTFPPKFRKFCLNASKAFLTSHQLRLSFLLPQKRTNAQFTLQLWSEIVFRIATCSDHAVAMPSSGSEAISLDKNGKKTARRCASSPCTDSLVEIEHFLPFCANNMQSLSHFRSRDLINVFLPFFHLHFIILRTSKVSASKW